MMTLQESPKVETPVGVDLLLAGFLYCTTTIAFLPWYSARLFDRGVFASTYEHGVYRFRVIGVQLTLLLDRLIPDNPLGRHLVVNGRRPHAGELFTSLFLLNGIALIGIVILSRRLLRQASIAEPARTLLMTALVTIITLSSSTVTPYDFLSYLIMLAILTAAMASRPWDLACIPLVVLGILTRESCFLALAALVAYAVMYRSNRRDRTIIATATCAAMLTYIGLRVVVPGPHVDLWSGLTLRGNAGRLIEWFGLASIVAACLVWRQFLALAGLDGPQSRRAAVMFQILSAPYTAVAVLTGYWFEVRLIVPLLLVELWIRCVAVADTPAEIVASSN